MQREDIPADQDLRREIYDWIQLGEVS